MTNKKQLLCIVVMKVSELKLSEPTAAKLQKAAERQCFSPAVVDPEYRRKLPQLEEEFSRSAEYVLQKNADLYRRLS